MTEEVLLVVLLQLFEFVFGRGKGGRAWERGIGRSALCVYMHLKGYLSGLTSPRKSKIYTPLISSAQCDLTRA